MNRIFIKIVFWFSLITVAMFCLLALFAPEEMTRGFVMGYVMGLAIARLIIYWTFRLMEKEDQKNDFV